MLRLENMRVVAVSVDLGEKVLNVTLDWKDKRCDCQSCGTKNAARQIKRESRKQPVRHLNCFEFKTLLHFDNVEMKCDRCRALFNRRPSFMGDSRFMTSAMLEDWMIKARATSPGQVAIWHDESDRTFTDTYFRQLRKADENRTLPKVKRLGIDEIAMEKGQSDYVLLLYDLDAHEVIDVLPDRLKKTLIAYLREHQEDMFSELSLVCTDLYKNYGDAVLTVFPHVEVVADRFHVEKLLNEALDSCRLEVQNRLSDPDEKRQWKKEYRHRILRARENQLARPNGEAELQEVLDQSPELKRLYRLKESFRHIYELTDPKEALKKLNNWLRRATYAKIEHLKSFIGTVKRWKKQIVAYVAHRITNGVSEGLNCKVKLYKRMGYGYRNFANFRLRILHTCSNSLV